MRTRTCQKTRGRRRKGAGQGHSHCGAHHQVIHAGPRPICRGEREAPSSRHEAKPLNWWRRNKRHKTYSWGSGPALPVEEDAGAQLLGRGNRNAACHVHHVRLGVAVPVMVGGESRNRRGGGNIEPRETERTSSVTVRPRNDDNAPSTEPIGWRGTQRAADYATGKLGGATYFGWVSLLIHALSLVRSNRPVPTAGRQKKRQKREDRGSGRGEGGVEAGQRLKERYHGNTPAGSVTASERRGRRTPRVTTSGMPPRPPAHATDDEDATHRVCHRPPARRRAPTCPTTPPRRPSTQQPPPALVGPSGYPHRPPYPTDSAPLPLHHPPPHHAPVLSRSSRPTGSSRRSRPPGTASTTVRRPASSELVHSRSRGLCSTTHSATMAPTSRTRRPSTVMTGTIY